MDELSKCQSCGADIIWITCLKSDGSVGKQMPIDAEHNGMGMVRFGENGKLAKFTKVYKSHFATCPYAKEHRTGDT